MKNNEKDQHLVQGEHMSFTIGGIQCDNSACDYRDNSVKFEDYPAWLNKPCPQCSSNLLTEFDYNECKKVVELSTLLNNMTPEEIALLIGEDYSPNDEKIGISIELNGTDNVSVKEIKL